MDHKIYGKVLKNLIIFIEFKDIGFEYLLNPVTDELHNVYSDYYDSHILHLANLEDFIGIVNIGGLIKIHRLPEGTEVPIYDLITGELIGDYVLNMCKHCKWD